MVNNRKLFIVVESDFAEAPTVWESSYFSLSSAVEAIKDYVSESGYDFYFDENELYWNGTVGSISIHRIDIDKVVTRIEL